MNDPFLKPVILGGLLITILSIVFAPGLFIWAIVGGFIAIRLASKVIAGKIPLMDTLLVGVFSGLIGGTCLDIITVISFNSPDNKIMLINALKKNWPIDIPKPDFQQILPSIFFTTCALIVIASVIFAIIGSYLGTVIPKRSTNDKPKT
ncbi:MAG: hypothetical protein A3B68_07405 [Candidatus Melainabacteria bacterium RIFCSPHIGHO2_02_FULL_34_12]|nr:MAG: hypothetical protein A3B68_07405 [Candidatus Melainabacteria bacterium RIFCSPHIGHO2_02_FULL_34_12]